MKDIKFTPAEETVFALRSLYGKYGYSQYKMNKFEEYELYVRNKDFLSSMNIITFTDTDGKLMALKPDITLSIVRDSEDEPGCVQKVFYNENVYRVPDGGGFFREIMQVGIECIGDTDDYAVLEVLTLAAKSLGIISPECIMDVSNMSIVSGLIRGLGAGTDVENSIMKSIEEKNPHEIERACIDAGINDRRVEILKELATMYGRPEDVLPRLRQMAEAGSPDASNGEAPLIDIDEIARLENLIASIDDESLRGLIRLDFSIAGSIKYYNGIVFRGYVYGAPDAVLSGGQYDKLLSKMNKKSGAVGFAVYLDKLEALDDDENALDVDLLILYDENTDLKLLRDTIESEISLGQAVMAQKSIPHNLRYGRLVRIGTAEVE